MVDRIQSEAVWREMVRRYDPVKVRAPDDPNGPANRAIWFETINFGWILSEKVDGKRRILVQY